MQMKETDVLMLLFYSFIIIIIAIYDAVFKKTLNEDGYFLCESRAIYTSNQIFFLHISRCF